MKTLCFALAAAVSAASAGVANAQFSGDFSGDNTAPTVLGTGPFSDDFTISDASVVDASGASPDVDVFSFTIADGFQLDAITLTEFVSTDNVGFIAIAEGGSFPFDAAGLGGTPDTSLFLASALFGTSGADGTAPIVPDLLDEFVNNSAAGAGLTAPLAAGEYTIYVQQLGGAVIDYGLAFGVSAVPEPSSALLMLLTGVGAVAARRR